MSILKIVLAPFVVFGRILLWFAVRIVMAFVVLYLIFHYVDIYKYVDREQLPPVAQSSVDYFHETSFDDMIKGIFSHISFSNISLPNVENPFSSDRILAINTNPNSDIAVVVDFDNRGGGIVVYTTTSGGLEKVNKIIARSQKGELSTMNIDPSSGLPKTLEVDGYTYNYHQFTNNSADVSITDPEGNTSEIQTFLYDFDQKFAIDSIFTRVAHASAFSWVADKIGKFLVKTGVANTWDATDDDDTKDAALWGEYINIIENIAVCGLGLTTSIIPNPVSVGAAVWGCSNLLAQTLPNYVPIDVADVDICNTKDVNTTSCLGALITGVEKIADEATGKTIYLRGRVTTERPNILEESPAKITFINTDTRKSFILKDVVRNYGFTSEHPGATLKPGGYDIVVEAKGYQTRTFTLDFDDDYHMFVWEDNNIVYDKTVGWPKNHFWKVKLFTAEEVEEKEDVVDNMVVEASEFDGVWKGSGKATDIKPSDYAEECQRDIPFTLNIENGAGKGKPDIKIKYDVLNISGRIDNQGVMKGKLKAVYLFTLGKFDIQFYGDEALGTWESERFQCSGSVTLYRE